MTHSYQLFRIAKAACIALCLGIATQASASSDIQVRHLASEQNIVTITRAQKYLLLPVQDDAPEAQVRIVKDNMPVGVAFNVRLARQRIDYYVPLELSAYQGDNVSISIMGLPEHAQCWKGLKQSDTFDLGNREKFRPLYHHTPLYGWMNDPNGMFYKDGVYHLYFQHNPYGSLWGNMSWGHSTSTDLVNWEFQGIPIRPDAWGTIFSGSAVIDHENTAGFGKGAVVAIYTSDNRGSQSQSIAYSLDNGQTFTKYAGNPVLTSTQRDFRDPKVFWYAPGKHWVMILAVGQEMQIFSSANLKEWKHESSFGAKQGAHGGVWECPDLVELPVEDTQEKRWVLICNVNPGGPFGGSAAQYFVGTFDGKKFTNEAPTETKWMDWGKDNYATVTFSGTPNGRVIAMGWMNNIQYQPLMPTRQYRGANTIARDLTLYRQDGELYLKSAPAKEMEKTRSEKKTIPAFTVKESRRISPLLDDNKGAYELVMNLRNHGASRIVFTLSNDQGEKIYMYYNIQRKKFVMDRSESGLTGFSRDFPALTAAPVHDTDDIHLRIFVDRSSIEVFGDGGEYVMTNRVFPSTPYSTLTFEGRHGNYEVKSLSVYKIRTARDPH